MGFLVWHIIAGICYFTSSCSSKNVEPPANIIDLTHDFDETTIYWVTGKPLKLTVTYNGTYLRDDIWRQADEISAATHGGTHMDAPCHYALGSWCVADIPLERLVVPAVVVDISGEVKTNPSVHFTTDHLKSWEKKHGKIPDGSVLMVYTGWSKYWPDRLSYTGTIDNDITKLRFPSIQPGVGAWLIEHRDIVGIGIDSMSIDIPGGIPQNHVDLMTKNVYALENVKNLRLLPPTGSVVYVMPMKLRSASGAPCRLIAQLDSNGRSGAEQRVLPFYNILLVIGIYYIYHESRRHL